MSFSNTFSYAGLTGRKHGAIVQQQQQQNTNLKEIALARLIAGDTYSEVANCKDCGDPIEEPEYCDYCLAQSVREGEPPEIEEEYSYPITVTCGPEPEPEPETQASEKKVCGYCHKASALPGGFLPAGPGGRECFRRGRDFGTP